MEKFIETFMGEYAKNTKDLCAVLSNQGDAIVKLGECVTILKNRIETLEFQIGSKGLYLYEKPEINRSGN